MEYYNLDKKSDSTRGRKSLDMKHDPTPTGPLLTGLPGKSGSEKISSLVQQMEQQKMNQMMQHQNAMSSLFGNMGTNMSPFSSPLRSLIPTGNGSPLMGGIGSLLGGPPMFSLSNLQKTPGSMFPSMQQGIASSLLHPAVSSAAAVSTTPTLSLGTPSSSPEKQQGIKLPLKLESPPAKSVAATDLSLAARLDQQAAEAQAHAQAAVAATLAGYKSSASPPPGTGSPGREVSSVPVQPVAPTSQSVVKEEQPQDLSVSKRSPPPPALIQQTARRESTESGASEMYTYSSILRAEECSPMVDSPMSASVAEDSDAAPTPPPQTAQLTWEKQSEMSRKITEKLLKASGPCSDGNCTHAQKLLSLRKNIVRILNVLTPDMSIEDGMDYRTDQVDQLLYDVIYCSMDEIEGGGTGGRRDNSTHRGTGVTTGGCRESSLKT